MPPVSAQPRDEVAQVGVTVDHPARRRVRIPFVVAAVVKGNPLPIEGVRVPLQALKGLPGQGDQPLSESGGGEGEEHERGEYKSRAFAERHQRKPFSSTPGGGA